MDRKLREDLIKAAERGAYLAMMRANEQYISAEELCKQFQMIPKSWLKTHKHLLPQGTLRYRDKDGNEKVTNPAYPKHRINQMIMEGKLDFTEHCEYRPTR